jgi:outer membrane protein
VKDLASQVAHASSRLSVLVAKAWADNPEIGIARAVEHADEARITQAEGRLGPQLTLSAEANTYRISESAGDYSRNDHALTGSLTYSLYDSRLLGDLDLARSTKRESELTRLEAASDLAIRLISAYIEINNLREDMRAQEAERTLVMNLRDVNQRRLDGGIGVITDVTESDFRSKILATQIHALRQDIDVQLADLRRYSGDPRADARALGRDAPNLIPAGLDEARAELDTRNPSLMRARQALVSARLKRGIEGKAWRPTVDIVGEVSTARDQSDGVTWTTNTTSLLGMRMSMPLYTSGVLSAVEREMSALELKAEMDVRSVRDRLHGELARAYTELEKFNAQAEAYRLSLELALTVSERTRKSYLAGFRGNIDVINAQRQISEVGRDLAKARAGAVLAQARILALMGRLDEGSLRDLDRCFGS